MFNAFQWNYFNLVDTCNIALILFLKRDVTNLRFPLPCRTMSHFVNPLRPLNVWRNLWMPPNACLTRGHFLINKLKHITVQLLAQRLACHLVRSSEHTLPQEIRVYIKWPIWENSLLTHPLIHFDTMAICCCRGCLLFYKPQLTYGWPLYTSPLTPTIL